MFTYLVGMKRNYDSQPFTFWPSYGQCIIQRNLELFMVRQASSVVASERCTALYAAVRRGARQFYHGEAAKRVSSASLFLATVDVSVKLKEAP